MVYLNPKWKCKFIAASQSLDVKAAMLRLAAAAKNFLPDYIQLAKMPLTATHWGRDHEPAGSCIQSPYSAVRKKQHLLLNTGSHCSTALWKAFHWGTLFKGTALAAARRYGEALPKEETLVLAQKNFPWRALERRNVLLHFIFIFTLLDGLLMTSYVFGVFYSCLV